MPAPLPLSQRVPEGEGMYVLKRRTQLDSAAIRKARKPKPFEIVPGGFSLHEIRHHPARAGPDTESMAAETGGDVQAAWLGDFVHHGYDIRCGVDHPGPGFLEGNVRELGYAFGHAQAHELEGLR